MTQVTLWVDAIEPRQGGIGRYTWELTKGLGRHPGLTVRYFGRNQILTDPSVLLRGDAPPPRRGRLSRWWQKRALTSSLVHGPNYFLPSFARAGVITVHDLSVFRFPDTHPAERVLEFEREFHHSLARATHVITDTETVRIELIEAFNLDPARVTAIHLGVDTAFRRHSSDELILPLRRMGLHPGGYGLCVSTLEPRKKIAELLVAWRSLPEAVRRAFPLVLCGGDGWRNESLHAAIQRGVAEGWLHHLGFIEERLLPALYAGAALFVYPSIYEGFGLPPIEAMASGVPVMVSRHSCLPEVCGGAARYFDPDDARAFIAAIERNLKDSEWRSQAIALGLSRSRDFDWDRCIDQTVEVYRQASRALGKSEK